MKSDRLIILACSQRKRPGPGRTPAIERYDGPLWQTLRAVDRDGRLAQVAFLSARYGLGDARWIEIPDYDAVLTDATAAAMIAGGTATRWPRPPTARLPDTFGIHSAAEISSMASAAGRPFREVALVGGHRYIAVMQAWLPEFVDGGWVTRDAGVTVINGQIGVMRQQMRAWLER